MRVLFWHHSPVVTQAVTHAYAGTMAAVGGGWWVMASVLAAGSAVAASGQRESLEMTIPIVSMPVRSDGQDLIAFELHVVNTGSEPLTLKAVRLLDGAGGRLVVIWSDAALAARLRVDGGNDGPSLTLAPGARAIVFVEACAAVVRRGRVWAEIVGADAKGGAWAVAAPAVAVQSTPAPVLAPPLAGGPWVAVHDPGWPRGHRRVSYTLEGRERLPGRFAVDWVGTDEAGRTTRGDPDRPADAIGYGAPVLAGADATVAAVRDRMTESGSITGNPAHPLGEGAGNFVVLRLSADRYAFYEHLKPGSVRVRPGERVRAGQVIGRLGFTGDSTGPHLHMHVADCASPLGCEGVPFTVRGMTGRGRYANLSTLGTRRWVGPAQGAMPPEWPGPNVVVQFPD